MVVLHRMCVAVVLVALHIRWRAISAGLRLGWAGSKYVGSNITSALVFVSCAYGVSIENA